MKCERCEHTIATDSPVWCQECHDARITDVQDEFGGQLDALRETINDSLPRYELDDGEGDEANAVETVEYAGRELQAWKLRWQSASEACDEERKWLREVLLHAGLDASLTGEEAFHAVTEQGEKLSKEREQLRALVREMWEHVSEWSGPTASSHYRSEIHECVRALAGAVT